MTDAKQVSKTFCALPFLHLSISTDGTTKLCCMASGNIQKDGAPMKLPDSSVADVWESEYLGAVRASMLEGAQVSDCSSCYASERLGGSSHRTNSNTRWSALVNSAGPDGAITPATAPLYYQLMPGNTCNLACRMCSPLYSSRIEADATHRKWSTFLGVQTSADWSHSPVKIGPADQVGTQLHGFNNAESYQGQLLRWTTARARIIIDVPDHTDVASLNLNIWPCHPDHHPVIVSVNGANHFNKRIAANTTSLKVDLTSVVDKSRLEIEIFSALISCESDERKLGLAIREIWLHFNTNTDARSEIGTSETAGAWHRNFDWSRENILDCSNELQVIYFTGGEPTVSKYVLQTLKELVSQGRSSRIKIEMNTNGTVFNRPLVNLFAKFESVDLAVSIDGFGAVNEYIRYPTNWTSVSSNLLEIKKSRPPQVRLSAICVIQVYNVLDITDLLTFLDGIEIPYCLEIATDPSILSVAWLPQRIRSIAAIRLRAYADTRAATRSYVYDIAQAIEQLPNGLSDTLTDLFFRFTNELDDARSQNFHQACPELSRLLSEELAELNSSASRSPSSFETI